MTYSGPSLSTDRWVVVGGLAWASDGESVKARCLLIRDGSSYPQVVYLVQSGARTLQEIGYEAWRFRVAAVRQVRTWHTKRVYGNDDVMTPCDGVPWEIHAIEDDELYLDALAAWMNAHAGE